MSGIDGMGQGGEGLSQGGIGSFVGKATGSLTGMNRAATGGPGMAQAAPGITAASSTGTNQTRKPMGLMNFLTGGLLGGLTGQGPLAGLLGPTVSALTSGGAHDGSSAPSQPSAPAAAASTFSGPLGAGRGTQSFHPGAAPAVASAPGNVATGAGAGARSTQSAGGPSTPAAVPGAATQQNATAVNATRKTEDFLGSFGAIASMAAPFLGPWAPVASGVGMLASGISKQNAQNGAAAAGQAATNNQNAIAGQLASGAQLDPLIKQEQAGITSAVENSNAANPGKLMMDLFGGAISNAIGGVASQRNQGLGAASDIYGQTGAVARGAATAGGNAWSPLAGLVSGLGNKGASGTGVATGAGSSQDYSDTAGVTAAGSGLDAGFQPLATQSFNPSAKKPTAQ